MNTEIANIVQKGIRHNNNDSAKHYLGRALNEARKNNIDTIKILYFIGVNNIKLAQYDEATSLLSSILDIQKNKIADSLKPFIITSLSTAYLFKGDYRAAINTIEEVQTYTSDEPHWQLNAYLITSHIWSSLPEVYRPKSHEKTLYYLAKARVIGLAQKDWQKYALILNNEGNEYLKMNLLNQCREKLTESIRIIEKNDLKNVKHFSLTTLGELDFREGKYLSAKKNLSAALQLSSVRSTETKNLLYINVILAKAHTALGEFEEAYKILNTVETAAIDQKDNANLMITYKALAELQKARKDFKKALEFYEKYRDLQDEISGRDVAYEINYLDLKYKETEKDKAILERELSIQKKDRNIESKNSQILLLAATLFCAILVILFFFNRYRQRKRMDKQLFNMERLRAVIQGEELERARIASELHDGIGGMLAVIGMNFSAASKEGFCNNQKVRKIQELLLQTSDEVRKTAHNLLPTALENNNLQEAVSVFCSEISHTKDLIVDLETQGDFAVLDATFNIAVFRIIQELFQNVIKHARASHIILTMEIEQDKMIVHVEDNGNGFAPDVATKGFGLKNIRDRVGRLGGHLEVKSQEGIGTSVFIVLDNLDHQIKQ